MIIRSEKYKEKQRQSQIGKKHNVSEIGRRKQAETGTNNLKKIVLGSNKNKKIPALSKVLLGHPAYENQKKVASENSKKLWQDSEYRNKMSKMISESNKRRKGWNHTQETKLKMGKFRKKYWENPQNKKKYYERISYISKPEKEMSQILNYLNIVYKQQHFINEIEHFYPVDFYLPDYNTVIEVDGKYWHNYPAGLEIDKIRNSELIAKGYKVFRFWEGEFDKDFVEGKLCL